MSIIGMKKLTVLAPAAEADRVVRCLMSKRCVEIRTVDITSDALLERFGGESEKAEAEARTVKVSDAIESVRKYAKGKKKRISVDRKAFINDGSYDRTWDKVNTVNGAVARRAECIKQLGTNNELMKTMAPWCHYNVMLGKKKTGTTNVYIGSFPGQMKIGDIENALEPYLAYPEEIFQDENALYASIICHRADDEDVRRVIAGLGFLRAPIKDIKDPAQKVYRAAAEEVKALNTELSEIEKTLIDSAAELDNMKALYDIEATELRVAINKTKLAATKSCVLLEGWVPVNREEAISDKLLTMDCAYETEAPGPEDEPPILLKNNGFSSNFEWVVAMYSYPKYGTYDPTVVMSIFYFIIFGMMFADVGYGLLLVLFGLLVPKLTDMRGTARRMFNMFGYCGIASIIFGVLFGGWFGDLPYAIMRGFMGIKNPEVVAPFFNGLPLKINGEVTNLNPTLQPMLLLIVSIAMGAIHIIGGMAVKFYILCRDGKVLDAIYDVLSWWLVFAGIGLIFVNTTVGMIVGGIGLVIIILTAGRSSRNPVMRILKGILGLYDIVNYASDMLSYSRILALGLAGSVIAQVINLIGTMNSGVVGVIMMVLVGLIGHLLNLAINVLGAFVHTSRLQFIEFFGKFFEDGGEQFIPEAPSEQYTDEVASDSDTTACPKIPADKTAQTAGINAGALTHV